MCVKRGCILDKLQTINYSNRKYIWRYIDGSLLHEMQGQEGNEKCQGHQNEEWQTGNPGCLRKMRYQDVPHRQSLKIV